MNELRIKAFISLADLFSSYNYQLLLVGGSVRDYLLNKELDDMDVVSDATPEEMRLFLKDADYTFSRFGTVKYIHDGIKFDITTMRKESDYSDSRHPGKIIFIKDIKEDVKRRDFTVNALYLNKDLKVIDLVNGVKDINNRVLKTIGDADKRIKEDPLRIIRAIRFAIDDDLSFDDELEKAVKDNIDLLDRLNSEKIKQDFKKLKNKDKDKLEEIFNKFHIPNKYNVIE